MTIRLSVRTAVWRSQVAQVAVSTPGLVPVIKGNGYGFGRLRLAEMAAEMSDTVAVGTIHELDGLPPMVNPVVLTPTLTIPSVDAGATEPILTVGRREHVEALAGWTGRVIVKRSSSMQRYGADDMALVDDATDAGLDVVGVAIHPPLAGSESERLAQVESLVASIDPSLPVWLSHLTADGVGSLPSSHAYRLRLGTSLWHGDKSTLELHADVLDVRPVRRDDVAGYRLGEVADDGHLVMIGAGTANGVAPLADGRSPFHFSRIRLALHEAPHMHTSMAFVPSGDPLPAVGDWVDLQRPLHMTTVDEYRWL